MLLLKGLAFGFVLAASVGPMWVLCFRRTVALGAWTGFASGMGIAAADGLYGAVAAFGLTAVSGFLLAYSFWISLLGSVFLIYLGLKALLAQPQLKDKNEEPLNPLSAFTSTLLLTLANPPTILAFLAVFASMGLAAGADYAAAALVVLGVFLGSALWWVILAAATGRLRGRIGPRLVRGINFASGLSLLSFALWQLAGLLR